VDRRRSVLTNAPRWIYVAVYQTRDENVSEMHNELRSMWLFFSNALAKYAIIFGITDWYIGKKILWNLI